MRNILVAMLFAVASQNIWSAVCAVNSTGNAIAIFALCIPAENKDLCDNDLPVTWPQITDQKVLANAPTKVMVSSSVSNLVWSPIQPFDLKNGQAIELYKQGGSLSFRVIDAAWCFEQDEVKVEAKKPRRRCTLY